MKLKTQIVSWEPEGRYHYSMMFRWKPEGAIAVPKMVR